VLRRHHIDQSVHAYRAYILYVSGFTFRFSPSSTSVKSVTDWCNAVL